MNRKILHITLIILSAISAGHKAKAQLPDHDNYDSGGSAPFYLRLESSEKHEADFHVNFRWDNAVILPSYMGTGENLKALADSIAAIRIGDRTTDSLYVVSYSSPEGNYNYNVALSGRRAAAMRRYLENEYPDLVEVMSATPDGESWQMFRQRALTDSTISSGQRERLLSIIDSNNSFETKKALIKEWDSALWNRIVREWFRDMRRSFIRLEWTENVYAKEYFIGRPAELTAKAYTAMEPLSRPQGEIVLERTILALKTNLLYDAMTMLNAEAEVPVGDRFSIMVEDVFPWWTFGPNGNKYSLEMWEIGIEPRWWFRRNDRRDRLSGHFVGPYVMSARYDFQWDRDLNYQGEYWSAGFSYGYAMPIGNIFNLEFSVSVGYVNADYRHYQPDWDYSQLYRDPFRTGTLSYFGPTKLKVSLVLPIKIKYTRR